MEKTERFGRRSLRQKGHDYSRKSAYFVTICTQDRLCLFGDVKKGKMVPNDPGRMVFSLWHRIPEMFPNVSLGECVVMPNHLHGILVVTASMRTIAGPEGTGQTSLTLGRMIGAFKSMTTVSYIRAVADFGWEPFENRIWQRNYYEKAIRNDGEMVAYTRYIVNNPKNWKLKDRKFEN